jgi:alkylhydroperoxidase family enzyme
MKPYLTFIVAAAISVNTCAGESASDEPKPVPATRPEIKAALEQLKRRTPRLPLPAADGVDSVNNGRMRSLYLPEAWNANSSSRASADRSRTRNNSAPTLDYVLTTSCFWVVSRGNNCHYCLGHQELKLAAAEVTDHRIAALDSNWAQFEPRTRAALAYARTVTLDPHLIDDADIAALKMHFTDAEIIELAFVCSRFNATNRWTDGLGIPQDDRFGDHASTFLTPTSDEYQRTSSIVTPETRASRPPLPTSEEIAAGTHAARFRTPRVQLPSASQAVRELGEALAGRDPEAWERALATLPDVGKSYVAAWSRIMYDHHLEPTLKAELAYITATNNRAWYATATAADRLRALGAKPELLLKPDATGPLDDPSHVARRLASKLTTDSHLITDRDIAEVRAQFSDAETAQIVYVICMANWFDRFTESLGLPSD